MFTYMNIYFPPHVYSTVAKLRLWLDMNSFAPQAKNKLLIHVYAKEKWKKKVILFSEINYKTEFKYIQGIFFKFKHIQVYLKEFRDSSIFKYFQGRYGPWSHVIKLLLFLFLIKDQAILRVPNKIFQNWHRT